MYGKRTFNSKLDSDYNTDGVLQSDILTCFIISN